MKKFRLLLGAVVGFTVFFSACTKDPKDEPNAKPEDPTTSANSLTYQFAKSNTWSSVAYKDVTLVEIHSDVEDYSLTYSAPKGYRLRLDKESIKGGAGFTVYRIVCDMDAVNIITPNNENEKVTIDYTITGNGYRDGKKAQISYDDSYSLQRYYQPEQNPKMLYNGWYLSEYRIQENYNWIEFETKYKYSEIKKEPVQFSEGKSPINLGYEILKETEGGNTHILYNLILTCTLDLPGWFECTQYIVSGDLMDSRFIFSSHPSDFGCSVFFINENKMLCMKGVYDVNGNLQRTIYYTFESR